MPIITCPCISKKLGRRGTLYPTGQLVDMCIDELMHGIPLLVTVMVYNDMGISNLVLHDFLYEAMNKVHTNPQADIIIYEYTKTQFNV